VSTLRTRAERFLFHEANLLDESRFDDWLALFEPDSYYWMPIERTETQRKRTPSYVDDNRPELELRIRRLLEPSAHTESPRPTACRVISNVVIEDEARCLVRSKLVMHEFRRREFGRDDYRLFCGTVRHGLRPDGESFRIAWKRIDLFDAAGSHALMPTPI
jgi:3-phenylpropionate/cinnamic acid dioxygenase small subunit